MQLPRPFYFLFLLVLNQAAMAGELEALRTFLDAVKARRVKSAVEIWAADTTNSATASTRAEIVHEIRKLLADASAPSLAKLVGIQLLLHWGIQIEENEERAVAEVLRDSMRSRERMRTGEQETRQRLVLEVLNAMPIRLTKTREMVHAVIESGIGTNRVAAAELFFSLLQTDPSLIETFEKENLWGSLLQRVVDLRKSYLGKLKTQRANSGPAKTSRDAVDRLTSCLQVAVRVQPALANSVFDPSTFLRTEAPAEKPRFVATPRILRPTRPIPTFAGPESAAPASPIFPPNTVVSANPEKGGGFVAIPGVEEALARSILRDRPAVVLSALRSLDSYPELKLETLDALRQVANRGMEFKDAIELAQKIFRRHALRTAEKVLTAQFEATAVCLLEVFRIRDGLPIPPPRPDEP